MAEFPSVGGFPVEQVTPPRTLREQALSVIRNALVTGALQPGEIYSAAALAQKLGVSNSPVREAMLTMVQDGIMEPVRNRGFRVAAPTPHDIDEVYQLRRLLEPPSLAVVTRSGAIRPRLAHFRELVRQIQAAGSAGDVYRFLDADRELHLGLLALTGNQRLVSIVAALRDQTRLYGLQALAEEHKLTESADEHEALVAAITAGDADAVVARMERHLDHTRGIWAGVTEQSRDRASQGGRPAQSR